MDGKWVSELWRYRELVYFLAWRDVKVRYKQAALGARSTLSGLKVTLPDISVTVAPDKQSAVADLTVVANVAGEQDAIVQEMKFTFRKTDDGWLITRVETVRTLSILNFELPYAPLIVIA